LSQETPHLDPLESLKREVLAANLELVAHGLVLFTFGNASGIDRNTSQVVIKPSGVNYDDLTWQQMVVCSLDGVVAPGSLRPSSDLDTHLHLYREFPEIGGVAHTHSTYATTWAQAGLAIPPYGTTHADYFHGPIPCTAALTDEECCGDYVLNTGKAITRLFQRDGLDPIAIPGVLITGHAPFCWGRTPAEAAYNAVILENVAELAWNTRVLNPQVAPVSQALLDRHYKRKHGPQATYGQ
jgi:L-ribulose-5-phosphate 4-epimerase